MRKILALALAVVMLASMAVPVAAGPITEPAEGAIRFVIRGVEELPGPGPFCPVYDGPNPGTTGGWRADGDFAFLNSYGSTDLYLGRHPIPPMGMPLAFTVNEGINLAGNTVPRHRGVLGMGMQAWIDYDSAGNRIHLPVGMWTLNVAMSQFVAETGSATLGGFELNLTLNNELAPVNRTPQSFPAIAREALPWPAPPAAGFDRWYVHNNITLDQSPNPLLLTASERVAEGMQIGVFGWEWLATLNGDHMLVGGVPNIQEGRAQALLVWTYVMV